MSAEPRKSPPDNPLDPVAAGRERIRAWNPGFTGRWLLVNVWDQRLVLVEDSKVAAFWPVSTAEIGLDNRQDSGGTPPGLHLIHQKIGDGADHDMIFSSRQSTGFLWRRERPADAPAESDDLILTRILTLEGLEEGVNRGPGVDSRERYIYIHGTNHEDRIGQPCSGGCVRMTGADVTELFALVEEGDPVVIL